MFRPNRRDHLARSLRFEALEERRVLSAVCVSTTSDVKDGDTTSITQLGLHPGADGKISLREAIEAAEGTAGADTIDFSTNPAYGLNGGTIVLTQGELPISESLTIDASMLNQGLTIDAHDTTPNTPDHPENWHDGIRIFNITDPSGETSITITGPTVGLTLTGGDPDGDGGAIQAQGQLTLTNCVITNNSARTGGGIHFDGRALSLQSSHIEQNLGTDGAGGLWASVSAFGSNGSITIEQSQVEENTMTAGFNRGAAGAYLLSNGSPVTITGSLFSGNQALGDDANVAGLSVIASGGANVVIERSEIVGNHTEDDVGGLYIENHDSTVAVQYSTISGNSAEGDPDFGVGGAWIANYGGSNSIEYSTISGNVSTTPLHPATDPRDGFAGGLFLQNFDGTITILNSTISGNMAEGAGGGIALDQSGAGEVSIRHSTIYGNSADTDGDDIGTGGGIYVGNSNTAVTIDHTIIAGNWRGSGTGSTRDDIDGPLEAGWSLIGDDTGATITNTNNGATNGGNLIGTGGSHIDPLLGLLADNGGPTETHSPRIGSPVIDAGDPAATGLPEFDQRGVGFPRKSGPSVDIGAHEVNAPRVSDVVIRGSGWNSAVSYSFASLVPQGKQLAPIFTERADTIRIQFTEDVQITEDALTLYRTPARYSTDWRVVPSIEIDFEYVADTHTGTWKFDPFSPTTPWNQLTPETLVPDRYQIFINPVLVTSSTSGANNLDGDWKNEFGPTGGLQTLYDWTNDPTGRTFLSGNGGSGTSFRFLFAYLPGDYDQNGFVDSGDEVVWAHPEVLTDGNGDGDGVQDSADHAVWGAHYGYALFGTPTGDYNHDGFVNGADWVVWQTTYGSTVNLAADGNSSSAVDTADYTVWRTWCGTDPFSQTVIGTKSAWDLTSIGSGAGTEYSDSSTAPRVMNVTVRGSQTSNENGSLDHYSFETHVGSGEQLRTVPVGGVDMVSITFDQQVNVEADYLRVVGFFTANVAELAEFSYDAETMTATWRFENLTANDIYVLSLSDAVTNLEGYRLDGEWTNPGCIGTTGVNEFPSGDGHAGGTFNFLVTLFAGDANLDNLADEADYDIWENHLAQDGGFVDGDFDGNGIIGLEDLALWELAQGMNLQGGVGIPSDLATADNVGDVDWRVNDADFEVVRANFGMSTAAYTNGDITGDGHVDLADVDFLMAQYGLELSVVI